MTTDSNKRHAFFIFALASSSLNNRDQVRVQNVALKMTCKKVLDFVWLNTISFLFNHIAQQMADIPTHI
jgi:hypothetical protein